MEQKTYKILHVVSGNYCLLAPIGYNVWIMDFCPDTGWNCPLFEISENIWEIFWNNVTIQQLHWRIKELYFSSIKSDKPIFTHIARSEFELI